ncbi:fumarylacetoacetate hydrolase family protein [Glutamicibacter sp.]|uniref:2-keto-4-pentenoate hydratase n=1 Tax=Glutamicibacter sp. TaxID=1931995 RepID=UPI0028BF3B3B|nr:fumarylacetoacetate hydrolase family protein [Glutamicibacter sp.]
MEASSIQSVARDLRLATRSGAPVSTLGTESLDLQLAAIIAAHGREIAEAEGDRVVGYKIGLTAAAVRDSFNADGPVQGYLLESTLIEAGGSISTEAMRNPAVEAEVAFIIGEPLNNPEATVEDVIAATKAVAPAIEIVDSRWTGGPSNLPLLVADNTNAAAAVVGEPVELPADIAAATSLLTVGTSEHPGSTETVMGNPLESVAWLARYLAQTADGLKPGDVILSGSMNVPAPLGDSTTATAAITGVGSVSANFH